MKKDYVSSRLNLLHTLALACLCVSVSIGDAAAHKNAPNVLLEASVEHGDLLNNPSIVSVTLTPNLNVSNVQVRFEVVYGDPWILGDIVFDLGDMTLGIAQTITTQIMFPSQGKSEIRPIVTGQNLTTGNFFQESLPIYTYVSGDVAVSSTTGYAEASLAALTSRQNSKSITQETYERQVHDILTGGAAVDTSVEAGPKGPTITVNGTIRWTDTAGTTHPARQIEVEILDENIDLLPDESVRTTNTNDAGFFSETIDNNDTFGTGGRDIFIRINTQNAWAKVRVAVNGDLHTLESTTSDDVADGSTVTINLTANNTDDNNQAVGVIDSFVTIGTYGDILGDIPLAVQALAYPGSGTFFDPVTNHIELVRGDWQDWDIIHHEYGHIFTETNLIQANPGRPHSTCKNMAETLGKPIGIPLTHDEGFATYFAISGQREMNAASLGIPLVGDTVYQDTVDQTIIYDLEINSSRCSGRGEDDEMSVLRILWDLYDSTDDANDKGIALGDDGVFRVARNGSATTLSEYWNSLINAKGLINLRTQVAYGCIFMDHNVSPEPLEPADGQEFIGSDAPPKFRWNRKGGGPSNRLNKFTVEFWNEDFTSHIFTSAEVVDSTGVDAEWTPTLEQWDTILGGGDVIKWIVKGRNDTAPLTGTYISCDRTISGVDVAFVIDDTASMSEEIGAVRSALTAFITAISGLKDPPTINLITFKDGVTSVIISDDLAAVQAAVDGLYAGGGGGCPEGSVEALDLARSHVRRGGRILFATDADAHTGLDIPGTIAAIRAQGIRVDTLISSACGYYKSSESDDPNLITGCNEPDCAGDIAEKLPDTCSDPPCDTEIPDPLDIPVDAIVVFSAFATQTGGVFSLVPEINGGVGNPARYENVALNIMLGTVFPTVLDSNPPQARQGQTLNVILTGSNTNFNSTSVVDFGDGITVNETDALSATSIRANITLAGAADLGFRTITVTTTLGKGTVLEEAEGLSVLEVLEEDILETPVIVSIFPTEAAQGDTLNVTISGANTSFSAASVVSFAPYVYGFDDVVVNEVTVLSSTELVANITVAADADLGLLSLTVTTDTEVAAETLPGPLLITSSDLRGALPQIVSISPTASQPDTTIVLTILGENTNFEDGVTVVDFTGSDITVNSTTVVSPTELTVNITIGSGATLGFRDVTATTGDEVAVALNGFEVGNAAPVADAGPDQMLTGGASTAVTLDGTGSSDLDGTVVGYNWTGTPDPDNVASPVVNLPVGEHIFTLIVTDDGGAMSSPDTVTITIEETTGCGAGPFEGSGSSHQPSDSLLVMLTVALLLFASRRRRRTN